MSEMRRISVVLCLAAACICVVDTGEEPVPNASDTGFTGSCTSGEDCDSTDGYTSAEPHTGGNWKPFRVTSKQKWIPFESVVEKYIEWHKQTFSDPQLHCSEKKVLVFTPSAGLGDSIGALTSAFMYALRTGRLFFIEWKPFPWSVTFADLPFSYNYEKVSLQRSETTGELLICPDRSDESSFISGHVTSGHAIVKEATGYDFNTEYEKMINFFMNPSPKVQTVIDGVVQRYFQLHDDDAILHKVAIVMRTGIGEYNQFLSVGDEVNFIECFINYAKQSKRMNTEGKAKKVKFVVFVTSDNDEAKKNAVEALREESVTGDIDIADVVTLEESAVHVMHMTREESKLKRVREKLRKTIAEFFLIARCDARFLTHGSLFGRSASELGGGPEHRNFFISDSHCDGYREKHSYLECHVPKYPKVCGFD